MSSLPDSVASPAGRSRVAAFTLLEVLVSIGIIVGALAGIAALLPAAGSRLGEATEIDRAGTMAANARADLANRGVIAKAIWSASKLAIVFGEGLTDDKGDSKIADRATIERADKDALEARIDRSSDFQLQDSSVGGGAAGVCYGCMLSSTTVPAAGEAVRATTVVFRKPNPAVVQFVLTGTTTSPVFTVTGTANAAGTVTQPGSPQLASLRSQYLPGCSWVLVVSDTSVSPLLEPRWVQIASSWTAYPPGVTSGQPTGPSNIVLTGTDWRAYVSGNNSVTLRVFGFDGLLRLDERFVNLE